MFKLSKSFFSLNKYLLSNYYAYVPFGILSNGYIQGNKTDTVPILMALESGSGEETLNK